MGRIVLVTGGARSGKSTFAEAKAKEFSKASSGNVLYIATSVPFDNEMKERVKHHKLSRPADWHTYEGYRDLNLVYSSQLEFDVILLDCITVMITNLIFDEIGDDFESLTVEEVSRLEGMILKEITLFLTTAKENAQKVVIVTNEVGLGLVPENKLGRIFRDLAGRINQYVAGHSDEVHMVVCGIPIRVK